MIEFPKALYKNNSENIEFTILNGSTNYEFQIGDEVQLGIKKYIGSDSYILKKTITVNAVCESINIHISSSDTADIPEFHNAILEVGIKYNNAYDYKTVYQEYIELKGVVLDE